MAKYANFESMVEDGIIQPIESPNCVETMQREFIEYVAGESLACAYPVLKIYSNPRKAMQGGFIAAAFDNTFGALVYLTTQKIDMATIDMAINYHKPIFENDKLEVVVSLKSLGRTIVNMVGEAYDKEKNLIATATTNMILLDHK